MRLGERRESFRIKVPADYILELALWFRRNDPLVRLHVTAVGDPHMVMGPGRSSRLTIEDISANGLMVSFEVAAQLEHKKFIGRQVLVYLKLYDPGDSTGGTIFFLLGCEAIQASREGNRVFLGLDIQYEGLPDQHEKVVVFTNVQKFGISEWTRLCDDMDRKAGSRGVVRRPGLKLDRFLEEIAAAKKEPPSGGMER